MKAIEFILISASWIISELLFFSPASLECQRFSLFMLIPHLKMWLSALCIWTLSQHVLALFVPFAHFPPGKTCDIWTENRKEVLRCIPYCISGAIIHTQKIRHSDGQRNASNKGFFWQIIAEKRKYRDLICKVTESMFSFGLKHGVTQHHTESQISKSAPLPVCPPT